MKAHDVAAMMASEARLKSPDGDEFWVPEEFNGGHMWIAKFKGAGPWSRQPEGDSMFYVLEGQTEVTVLTDEGEEKTPVPKGSLFMLPKGVWHKHSADDWVSTIGVAPGPTERSDADDPRQG